uniref:Centrosomal protein of 290kDa coiled-coil region domain-containing protein n=1 Tax=Mucochytrium quahogii TaxID=96639 RepID=A0A7S2SL22_9STRA|mmetsp:Transcript_7595/g.16557  ORF Transcript_7595/g.16557 Transcript_7595/m.16557 type:complete len:2293 (+) Transcript_7595:99-6977(+)
MSAEELQQQLEDVIQTAETYAEQLSEKNDEIEELRERNRQLEEELMGEGRGGDLEMRDELRELRSRLEQAEDQLEKARDAAKEQESRARELDMQNKALKMEKLKLEADLQKEQERAETMEESMHTMRQRTEQAAESEGRLGAREKSHKKTLIKALGENEELRKSVAELGTDVQTLFQAVNEKDAAIEDFKNQLTAANQELQDNENEVEELKRLLKEKDNEIASAHDEINAVGELEVEIEERIKSKQEKWKAKMKVLQGELDEERKKQQTLQKKCDSLLLESGLREVEQELVSSEEKYKASVKELNETKQLLEQVHDEMLQVRQENENLKADQGKFIEVALEKEHQEMERLRQTISTKDTLLEEERTRYKELYEEKGHLEEELQDRDFTLAEYERGHGLTEAVVKQKKLKGDIKRRDKEIRRLNQALSERIHVYEKLYETARRLKLKAGLSEEFEFDDLVLEEGMKGQTERLQGLIRELEQQNEDLEDERLRLLESLRLNAQNMGDKGMKFYGLTADQVILVNRFVENLREGNVDLPLNDKSLQLKEEIKELKSHLRETQRDLAAAELELEGSGIRQDVATHAPSSPGDVDRRSPKHLERHMARMAQDQASMVSEIKQEIQRTLSSVIGMQQLEGEGSRRRSPPRSPKPEHGYEKLMGMLESKLGGGQLNSEQVTSMRNELERQSTMNEQLVKRLQETEQKLMQGQLSPRNVITTTTVTAPMTSDPGLLSTPVTRDGKRFQDHQIASLRLPPEEWAEQYILLNNRLVACMERVVQKEKEISKLQHSLHIYEDKIECFANQMGLLYREHLQAKNKWELETKGLSKEADEARGERDALRAKARRLDTLCAVLEGDENSARAHAKELTRKIAVLEVNEVVLARRYNLIAEEEKIMRHEKENLQQEMIQAETALRERVLYLEEWKSGAQFQLDNLEQRMTDAVPRETHELVVRRLSTIKHKYRQLLNREAQIRSKTSGAQALRRRVHELESELEIVRVDCLKAKQEANTAREQVEWVRNQQSASTTEPGSSLQQVDELVQQVAKFKGEALEKEIVLASALKKAQILEKRVVECTKDLDEETTRANLAELSLESSRDITNKIEQELIEMRDNYHGGANRAERKVMEERIQELEGMYQSLLRDNTRFRELADIASSQVCAFEMIQQAKEHEMESLRKQLWEANSRSDDDAIIGKLQHELTTTKVSYQMFVRKFEMAKVSIRRGELELRKVETQLDEKDRILRQTREEARARILSLEGALEQLGGSTANDQLVNSNPLSEFSMTGLERLSETIAKLGEAAEHSEESLRRSEAARRNLEKEIEAQRLELNGTKSILDDFKKFALAPDEGDVPSLVEQRDLGKRLLQLSDELKTAKIESMRQKRELQLLREEKQHMEKLREKDDEHMARLEESIANAENALRRREDDKHIRAASDPKASDGFGLPVLAFRSTRAQSREQQQTTQQPEQQTTTVPQKQSQEDKSELVTELQNQICEAEKREDKLEGQLERKSSQIRYLRKKLQAEGLDDDDGRGGESEGEGPRHKPGKYYEADARKLQAAARQTVASLNDIVNRKNKIIDGLKSKMEYVQQQALAERERDQVEIERLTEKLYEDNRTAIGKLRSAYEDIAKGTVPGGSGGEPADVAYHRELMDRLDEADVMLERKERRLLDLEGQLEEMQILRTRAEERAGQSAEIAERLREKVKRLAIQSQSQSQEQLVKQLRNQLIGKDKKMAGLRAAVIALKTEFVKAEEEHEEELISRERQMSSALSGKPSTTQNGDGGNLKRQLSALKDRVESTREDLEKTKRREEKLQAQNSKLRRQLREQMDNQENRDEQSSRSSTDIRRYMKEIDELKRENRRLRDTVANAMTSVTMGPSSPRREDPATEQKVNHTNEKLKSQLRELERKIKISEAQNAALRSAARTPTAGQRTVKAASPVGKWEAEKKTEKRLSVLSKKLDERTKELQASRAQADQAKQLLEKATRDRQVLQTRLNRLSSSSTPQKMSSPQGGTHLRRQMDELEQELELKTRQNRDLRRQVEVEQRGEINTLRREVSATRARAIELEEELDIIKSRKKRSGGDSLQIAEEHYAREDEIRHQLAESRKAERALEAELLERDNTILELRFELEQETERQRKPSRPVLGEGKISEPRRGAGELFKRERDLENVVESMKKVVSKLQSENERLKRSTSGNARYSELGKRVKELERERDQLETSNEALSRRVQQNSEASTKVIRLEDAVKSLKKQIRSRDTALEKEKSKLDNLRDEGLLLRTPNGASALKYRTKRTLLTRYVRHHLPLVT